MQLIINKLRIEGKKYRRTLFFEKGLNIIAGDIYSGKSLVLRLIDYVFGKTKISLEAQKELDNYCDTVILEIEINKNIYTIKRNLKIKNTNFYVYFTNISSIEDFTPKVFLKKDYLKFLQTLLEIPEYKLIRHLPHSKSQTIESISFRDIFRFCYIDQHNFGTTNFLDKLDKMKFRKNKPTLDLMLNLILDDKEGINQELALKNNEKVGIEQMISSLKTYIRESDIESMDKLINEEKNQQIELINLIDNKKTVIHTIKQKKGNTNFIYKKLNSELNGLEKKLLSLNDEINNINLEIFSKTNLIEKYKKDIKEAEATKEANFYLKEIEQEIVCPLCNSKHPNKQSDYLFTNTTLEGILKESKSKINTVNNILEKLSNNKNKINEEISYINRKKNLLDEAIQSYTDNLEIPMLSEIEAMNTLIYKSRQRLIEIKENIKMHHKIEEKEKTINLLEKNISKLIDKLKNLFQDKKTTKEIIKEVNKSYIEILAKFDLNIDEEKTYIDNENYTPFYDGANVYQHDSGGILASIQIAFLGALLKMNSINKYNVLHPNILLLDTVGKYLGKNKKLFFKDEEYEIMDDKIYNKIYETLIELAENSQIIIVENTPRDSDSKYIKYIFTKKDGDKQKESSFGLIDLTKNEFYEID